MLVLNSSLTYGTRFGKVLSVNKIFVLLLVVLAVGCTEQSRAKQFGGDANVDLPKGEKLVVVTWKDADLWYLTRPFKEGDTVETYKFQESSSWGVMEGTIVIREHK